MSSSCFSDSFELSAGSLSEREIIRRICSGLRPCVPPPPLGPGDDCSVSDTAMFGRRMLSTSDAVILGRHFSPETSGFDAGRKLMNRNISDIASMGGTPVMAVSSAVISPEISLAWLDDFCRGVSRAASEYGVIFSGGDVARGGPRYFSMHLTLLGKAERPLLRTGAVPGDRLFVTGPLGRSFQSGRHLSFAPRVADGLFLASVPGVAACTDLSDGLAEDIFDILPAGASASLAPGAVPLFDFPGNSLSNALSDGEDYELLFALRAADSASARAFSSAFERKLGRPVFEIGRVIQTPEGAGRGIFLESGDGSLEAFRGRGYSHFA